MNTCKVFVEKKTNAEERGTGGKEDRWDRDGPRDGALPISHEREGGSCIRVYIDALCTHGANLTFWADALQDYKLN